MSELLFLHQLTHNMTTDYSLNYKFNTWKFQAKNIGRTFCVQKLFLTLRTISVHDMFSPICCTNKSFWQRFTCKGQIFTGCNYDTLYRHPAECNMYLQCSNGYEYIFTCPLDLVFNEILQVCDYVENVPECNGEITTTTATTTTSGKKK